MSAGARSACSPKPSSCNQRRTAGVRSGSRRVRVQRTVPPGAELRQGTDRPPHVGVADVPEHAGQQDQVGRDQPVVRRELARVSLDDLDLAQAGQAHRALCPRDVACVVLQKSGPHPVRVVPRRKDPEQVMALACADAHDCEGLPPGARPATTTALAAADAGDATRRDRSEPGWV